MFSKKNFMYYTRTIHIYVITGIGYISVTFMTCYSAPVEDDILRTGLMTINTYPMFAAALVFGTMIGSIFVGLLNEWLGVKTCLMIFSQLGTLGGMLIVLGYDGESMIVGRVLIGIYSAFCYAGLPVYGTEIAQPSMKKLTGSLVGVSLRIGTLFCFIVGVWIEYRWLAVMYVAMVVFTCLNLLLLPESPKWLKDRNWVEQAMKANDYFKVHPQENDLHINYESIEYFSVHDTSLTQKLSSYFIWPVIRPLLVSTSLQIFKAISAHEFLIAYSAHTLDNAVNIDSRIAEIFYPVSLLIGAILFLYLIHKFEWKRLLLITSCGQILANGLLGLVLYFSIQKLDCTRNSHRYAICDTLLIAPMILIIIYGVSFGMGWGSIAWWSYGNILHSKYTRMSAGIATFISMTLLLANQLIAAFIVEYFGAHVLFFVYSGICVCGLLIQCLY